MQKDTILSARCWLETILMNDCAREEVLYSYTQGTCKPLILYFSTLHATDQLGTKGFGASKLSRMRQALLIFSCKR